MNDKCGTLAGYVAHKRSDNDPCDACRSAAANYESRRWLDAQTGQPRWVNLLGTRRRIQALMALGWTTRDLTERLGIRDRNGLHALLNQASVCRRVTAEKVAALYDELSGTPGPSPITRQRALAKGWAPPAAWDDIDNDERPHRADRRDRRMTSIEVIEEFDWLVSCGESEEQAAARLGVLLETIRTTRIRNAKKSAA